VISFIIPAYNEELLLGKTLDTLLASARAVNEPFEVIVVNDASADHTADVARERGVRVVDVHCRQIAAVRNAGAREAQGDILFFLDADTLLPDATLREALSTLQAGAVGGGARVAFDQRGPFLMRVAVDLFSFSWFTLARWAAGCCIFVRRDAFEKAGGFDERYFVSEELHFSRALKRVGRFCILKTKVITSSRKLRLLTPWRVLGTLLRLAFRGPRAWRRREGLEMWYDGRREAKRP